jgi:hypothetical protein
VSTEAHITDAEETAPDEGGGDSDADADATDGSDQNTA